MNQQVEEKSNTQVTQPQHSISILEEQLKQNAEERAQLHAAYRTDLAMIQEMQKELEA